MNLLSQPYISNETEQKLIKEHMSRKVCVLERDFLYDGELEVLENDLYEHSSE